jgi:hypothetical protein
MTTHRGIGRPAVSAYLAPLVAAAARHLGGVWVGPDLSPATARRQTIGRPVRCVQRACAADVWASASMPLPACAGRSPRGHGLARPQAVMTDADAEAALASDLGPGYTTARLRPRRPARTTPALTGCVSGRDDQPERMIHSAADTRRGDAADRTGTQAMSPHAATDEALATGQCACRTLAATAGAPRRGDGRARRSL